ncbi:hypothetical protein KP509_30G022100 [Ceratopteris richardii]|uniref:Uncharacterized protein n=1 Tax=Ceratopteris richardii TaxID=49495 RepID=A0A8T2R0J3_CERRI|nr:hypothetical protein KP509_30G022100 [Ceratopteris richardii]
MGFLILSLSCTFFSAWLAQKEKLTQKTERMDFMRGIALHDDMMISANEFIGLFYC